MSVEFLRDVGKWRDRLGFLPVPLAAFDDHDRFVLLNGPKGNFCLDIANELPDDARTIAWSTDTGHFVAVSEGKVRVWRWDRFTHSEFTAQTVWENLERFQSLLESEAPSRERSIVAHFMRGYRSLRNSIVQADPSSDALDAFLALLVRTYENEADNGRAIDLSHLLTPEVVAGRGRLEALPAADVDFIIQDLLGGLSAEGVTPKMRLVFRHASGRLFQEAHYLAETSPQRTLFAPDPARIRGKGSATGAYFTPTSLVRAIVERTFAAVSPNGQGIVIFDPACGGAEFLREALRGLALRQFRGKVRLIGWDISFAACTMARFALACEQRDFPGEVEIDIRHVDSIGEAWPTGVDFILTNPPFQSWRDMSRGTKECVGGALGDLKKGRPDLASVFLLKAAQAIKRDGAIGFVLPASILDGESAAPIRHAVSEIVCPAFIARLGNHLIFEEVTVDSGVFIGVATDAERACQPPVVLWSDRMPGSADRGFRALRRSGAGGRVLPPVLDEDPHFSVYATEDPRRAENWTVRPYKASKLLARTEHTLHVEDLFIVRQGTLTGLNAAFVVQKEFVDRLPKAERHYFRPALMNDSVISGRLFDKYRVFFPYGEGIEPIRSEGNLRDVVPTFLSRHLAAYKETLKRRSEGMSRHWWVLTRHRSHQIPRTPKLVSKYFGMHGAFAFDEAGDFVVVQGYVWEPKKPKAFRDNPGCNYAYVAFLSSELIDTLLAAVSNSMAGGQWNLSARFVKRMPLPDLTSIPKDILETLAELGRQISTGGKIDGTELDRLVQLAWDALRE